MNRHLEGSQQAKAVDTREGGEGLIGEGGRTDVGGCGREEEKKGGGWCWETNGRQEDEGGASFPFHARSQQRSRDDVRQRNLGGGKGCCES